jgi:hypothetical protein
VTFLGDQLERGADQRFLQIAVVIAARTRAAALAPFHVQVFFM